MSEQTLKFQAARDGNAYRGEVVDLVSFDTLAKTHLTYPNEVTAAIAARRMWEGWAQRIARATMVAGAVA
jgi:hypothetical protein